MLSSFKVSHSAGKVRLRVLSLIQASVQLVSSKAKFIWGCSSGGMGLSFLQENIISDVNSNVQTKIEPFIRTPNHFRKS